MLPSVVMMLLQNAAVIFTAQLFVIKLFSQAGKNIEESLKQVLLEGLTSPAFTLIALLVYAVIGCFVFFFWYQSIKKKAQHDGTKDKAPVMGNDTVKGYSPVMFVGIFVFVTSLNYICQFLIAILSKAHPEWLEWFQELMSSIDMSDESLLVPTVLYTVILGPLCEELCFRGLTLNLAKQMMPPAMANLIQALLFGGIHGNPLQSIYAFLVGWFFGKIYLETNNLCLVVIAHITFNAVGSFLGQFFVIGQTPFAFFSIFFTSMLGAYFGYLLILKAQQDKTEKAAA